MSDLLQKQIEHTFNRRNLLIALKSFFHGLAAILITQAFPPHYWQISFASGLAYGTTMHALLHYRDDAAHARRE